MRREIILYYIFSFLRGCFLFSGVIIPFFRERGNLDQAQIQLLQSWFMLCMFMFEIPTGTVADRVGRKYSLALGSICQAAACLMYGTFRSIPGFIFSETIFAAGVTLHSGADKAFLFDTLKEHGREKESANFMGKAHAFFLAGILVTAPAGSLIAGHMGVQYAMLLSAIPFSAAALIALAFTEPECGFNEKEERSFSRILKKGFHAVMLRRRARRLAIDGVMVGVAGYFVIWLYQPLLMALGIPVIIFGFVHSLLCGGEIIIAANFRRLEKLCGSKGRLLKWSAGLTLIGFLAPAAIQSAPSVIFFVLLGGGFGLTRLELVSAYLNRLIPSSERATALSFVSMLQNLVLLPINPVIGYAADSSLQFALLVCCIGPLISLLFAPVSPMRLRNSSIIAPDN